MLSKTLRILQVLSMMRADEMLLVLSAIKIQSSKMIFKHTGFVFRKEICINFITAMTE